MELRRTVLLALQVALLGMVAQNLRAVTVGWSSSTVDAVLLFDGAIGDTEIEAASDIEAELIASLPAHQATATASRYDAPAPLNERGLDAWAYQRRE